MLTKPSALIWYVTTIYCIESHFFTFFAVASQNFEIFQNWKSLYLEIQVVFEFGEESMKITLILFIKCHFLIETILKKQEILGFSL